MKKIQLTLIILFISTSSAFSQKQGNIWYFGNKAGLDFNTETPVELTDGQINTFEGCASMCDKNGHLLFYTDGISVWNRRHTKMPNGTGLAGNSTSTQSGVIVPLIGDTNIYYIFTVDYQGGTKGIEYSILDMSADNGDGDITSKNNFLYYPACEKITAVSVSDGSGYWIITHQYGTDVFVTYKLTSKGLSKVSVKSKSGPSIKNTNSFNTIGYLVISPDNKKLGMANHALGDVELFDFDNTKGKIFNAIQLNSNGGDYGVCFSPNSKVLYISQESIITGSKSHVQQYDLTATDIPGSMYSFITNDSGSYGAMQMGPDGKIYIARLGKHYLDVIQNPNDLGSSCNYTFRGMNIIKGTVLGGLPNIPPFNYSQAIINYTSRCYLDTFHFYSGYAFNKDSTNWIIKQPNGNKQKFKNKDTINRVFKDTGTYIVYYQIYNKKNLSIDSVAIHVLPTPDINLGNDTLLCSTSPLTLKAPAGYATYTWQDGSNKQSFDVQKTGKYWLKAQTGNCVKSDTINIVQADPKINKLKTLDTLVCPGFSFSKDISQQGCKYLWNDGDTQHVRNFINEGIYTVKVYNPCAFVTDTFKVNVDWPLKFDLGRDTTICKSAGYVLHAPDSFSYLWQDGSKGSSIKVNKAGKYKVTIFKKCETLKDSVNISFYPDAPISIKKDTIVCEKTTITVDISKTGFDYLWNDGSTQPKRAYTKEGLYTAKIYNLCGYIMDTFRIKVDSPLKFIHWKDTIICKESGLTLYAPNNHIGVWQNGVVANNIKVATAGKYKFSIFRKCEVVSDSINISFYPEIKPLRNIDTIVCNSTIHCDYTIPGANYLWNDGYNKAVRDINTTGLYYCTVSNKCYQATDSVRLLVQHPLTVNLGSDTTLCPGKILVLHAPNSNANLWQDGSNKATYIVNKAGHYKVSSANVCGSSSDSIYVKYVPPYFFTLPKDTTLCEGDSMMVNAYSIPGHYTWNNGSIGSKATLKQGGKNILTFKNQCQTITDTINIKTDSFCHCSLYTPDIFSPDSDGINDTWKPSSCSYYKSYYLQVYNRWGERVFTTDNLNEGWDGRCRGKDAMEGMYLFLIKLIDIRNENNYKSGRFYLIRH